MKMPFFVKVLEEDLRFWERAAHSSGRIHYHYRDPQVPELAQTDTLTLSSEKPLVPGQHLFCAIGTEKYGENWRVHIRLKPLSKPPFDHRRLRLRISKMYFSDSYPPRIILADLAEPAPALSQPNPPKMKQKLANVRAIASKKPPPKAARKSSSRKCKLCSGKNKAHGFCDTHYRAYLRGQISVSGKPMPGKKKCRVCRKPLPRTAGNLTVHPKCRMK
jgi:hypothetical protein